MNAVFILLTVQVLAGAFDTFWHHELQDRKSTRLNSSHSS